MSPGCSSVASAPHSQLILSRVSPTASLTSLASDQPSGSPGSYQARARQVSPYNYSGADTVSWACRQGSAVSASQENLGKIDTRSEVHIIHHPQEHVFSFFYFF